MNMELRGGSIYTQTARFDRARALTEDELRQTAPSVFAATAHDSCSERFRPIPTIEVVRGLAREGLSVVGARQAIVRQEGRENFTKHLLRLRRLDDDRRYHGDPWRLSDELPPASGKGHSTPPMQNG